MAARNNGGVNRKVGYFGTFFRQQSVRELKWKKGS